MEVEFTPFYLRCLKKLDGHIKEGIKETTTSVIDYYTSGKKTHGLGVRHLRSAIWEARDTRAIRVVYQLGHNQIRFLLAGNHDDVRRLLKRL